MRLTNKHMKDLKITDAQIADEIFIPGDQVKLPWPPTGEDTTEYSCGCMEYYRDDNSKDDVVRWYLCPNHAWAVKHLIKDAEQDAKILAKIDAFKDIVVKIVSRFQSIFLEYK